MFSDQPPQPESMAFPFLAIISTPQVKQIYVFSVLQPTIETLMFLFFFKFHFVSEHIKAMLCLLYFQDIIRSRVKSFSRVFITKSQLFLPAFLGKHFADHRNQEKVIY